MKQIIFKNDYFEASDIDRKNVLLTTKLVNLEESNVSIFIEALIMLTIKTEKEIIVDFSVLTSIDSHSMKKIYSEVNKINSIGRIVKIVVTEEKPKIGFSIGDPIDQIDLYLTRDEALDGLRAF